MFLASHALSSAGLRIMSTASCAEEHAPVLVSIGDDRVRHMRSSSPICY